MCNWPIIINVVEKLNLLNQISSQPQSQLIGGRLAVDFANATFSRDRNGNTVDGWDGLVEFLVVAGTASQERGSALQGLPLAAPEETAELLRRAIDLRSAVRQTLAARREHNPLEPDWIAQINSVLACTEGYERLEAASDSGSGTSDWRLRLAARSEGLEWLLAAIARSAAELVAEGTEAPVRICANPECGLFFYDASRTGRRRWCSMATCGNRAKVAAHSKRQKKNTKSTNE
jgi:predicted RNA-binding Zn ribbon-like protein